MAYKHVAVTTRNQAGSISTSTWLCELGETKVTSGKVSGSVVNVEGRLFRKATPYSTRSWRISPGGSQNSKAIWKKRGLPDAPVTTTSTPGGPQPDMPSWAVMYSGFLNPNTGMTNMGSFPSIPQSMRNEAVTKALLDLVGQSAQLGEDLATFGQTVRMLASPTVYLANELKRIWDEPAFRPFLRRTVRDILDHNPTDVARRYLEYVYGWRPLMQEIHTLVNMAKDTSKKPLLVHGRGVSSRYEAHPIVTYDQGPGQTVCKVQVNTKAVTRCNIWAKVDPNNQGIRSLNQLGLANPAALAWELMSWSFVVDWVLPIGAVLNALTASKGLVFVDGSVANRVKCSGTYNQVRNHDGKDTNGAHVWATGNIRYDGYTRSTLGDFPTPGLWLDHDALRGDRPFKAAALAVLALGSLR